MFQIRYEHHNTNHMILDKKVLTFNFDQANAKMMPC